MAAAPAPSTGLRLSAHPRARRHIAAAKTWGGVAAFALVATFSYRADVPFGDLLLRAVLAGIAGSLVCWFLTVTVWRHVALAQIERLRRQLLAEQHAREELLAAERRRLEQQAAGQAM